MGEEGRKTTTKEERTPEHLVPRNIVIADNDPSTPSCLVHASPISDESSLPFLLESFIKCVSACNKLEHLPMLEGKTNFFRGSNTSLQDITWGRETGIPKLRGQAKY